MIRFTVFGQLASMKNRRIPTKNNPRITVPNPECQVFERDFGYQVPVTAKKAIGSLTQPVRARITVYYPSMRSDLDCAYVYDLLQQNGVVSNDRYIRYKEEIARIDKKNPRVEIELEEIQCVS